MRTALVTTITIATLALLAGCTSGGGDDPKETTTPPAVESASPTEGATVAEEVPPGDPAVCEGDLSSAALTDAGDGLQVEWTVPTAPTGDVLWSATVQTPSYDAAYQVGYRSSGEVFVYDLLTYENLYVGRGSSTETGATATFPWALLAGLDGELEWRATLSVDGADIGACPAPGDGLLDPVKASFTR